MKLKYSFLISITFFLLIHLLELSSQEFKNLGVNLDAGGAFINMVNHENRFSNADSYDEHGWPNSDFDYLMMDQRPPREWSNEIDDPEEYRVDYSGVYKCSFIGQSDITIWGSDASIQNKTYNQETNTTFFEINVPGPFEAGDGIVGLGFQNTELNESAGVNTGIRSLKIYRPGYELDTKKIFTDDYISLCKAANFACYRYYTLQNIWGGEPQYPTRMKWEERKTPLDATQVPMGNTNGKMDAWSYEYIIELANTLHKDIWICIHISADTNYVTELAKMLKNNLKSNINIYVENSNEVWSPTHMTHGPYNQAQADEYGIGFNENYARRSVELSNLFAEVFGKDEINKKIRVILAGQQAYQGRSDIQLEYIKNNIGEPRDYIYATSTALYFGTNNPDGNPDEINNGMLEQIDAQITDTDLNTYRLNHIQKAESYNLIGGCTSYEGGPHYPAGNSLDNLDNGISSHRTEKMRDILFKNYGEAWFEQGGGLAMQFTLSGKYSRSGCWGLTDDVSKPDRNYKMQAMRDLVGSWEDNEEELVKVTGNVKLEDSDDHSQIFISIINNENSNTFTTSTNPLGDYELEIPADTYNLEYSKDGYYSQTFEQMDLSEDAELSDIILLKKPNSVIENHQNIIYPNPVGDYLNVNFSDKYEIRIYNLFGESIIFTTARKIDVSDLGAGIYFLVLDSRDQKHRYRFIKK